MTKQQINPYWLHVPLSPMTGLADDDECVIWYRSLNLRDDESLKQVIRKEIVPYFRRIDRESQNRIKLAYSYYLSKSDTSWDRVFHSMLPPFDLAIEPRAFFLLIWQECFPSEDWQIADLSAFKIKEDIEEPLRTIKLAKED